MLKEYYYSQTPLIHPSVIRLNGNPPGNGPEQTSPHRKSILLPNWLVRPTINPPKIVLGQMGVNRNYQSLKRAVGTILCQNEAALKISMEIDHQNSSTDQAGKIRLAELIINGIYFLSYAHKFLMFPACSVGEIWWKFPWEIILLPHSGRVSQQLLLLICDTSVKRSDCIS